ncbi:hypothetical protein PLEOSDRAFT_168604 [Pleurotus ostreatus PC15]|uniref:SNF2 N-terminal domain-containing protein n=1 Tax=Pleurotus ostreatus (strain PC15) TaxID=1137138 RepID=A0A067NSV1_PLEO1|nr:hypothetical protein PLEOSDRAFT_168604 [Pleurotus ostreatus PC15]
MARGFPVVSSTVHNMACWLPSYQLDAEANINLLQSVVDNALKMPDDAKTDAVHLIKLNAEEMVKKACAAGRRLQIAQVDLANKEEVSRILQEIVTHLETCFGEDDTAPYALRNIDNEFGLDGDLGVEFAAKLLYEDLQSLLGFIDGRPASWNPYVCIDRHTEWQIINAKEEIEDPSNGVNNANGARAAGQPTMAVSASSASPMLRATGQPGLPAGVNTTTASSASPMPRATGQSTTALRAGFQNGGPGFQEQRLLWHQLAGTCGIVHGMWTSERGERLPGTLLADGVGVGKTAQVMASIVFIQQVYLIKTTIKEGNTVLKCPPIISQSKWFMGGDSDEEIRTVPNLAHLIVVPLSLISQWLLELHQFFHKRAVDIFVLPNTADTVQLFFFSKNTAWKC